MGGWLVGTTVRVEIVVTDPDSMELRDPASVEVVSLTTGGTSIDVSSITPVRIGPGAYKILFSTEGFEPGTYVWLIRLTDDDGSVALSRDSFVLAPV